MGGHGPAPKHPSARRRRNRAATAAVLAHQDPAAVEVPPLPSTDVVEWHPMTVSWWQDVWASPMAPELDGSDIHGLFLLARLVDLFWREPSKELAGEIRLQARRFGLDPMSRRALNWQIEPPEPPAAAAEPEQPRKRAPRRRKPPEDPRAHLRAV